MGHTEAARLLSVWEEALPQAATDRARILHRAARPQAAPGELPRVPVGEREADLYALRRALFGDRMQVLLECASCGEALEFDLDARELAVRPGQSRQPLRVAADGWEVDFRLPSVADLEAAAATAAGADDPRAAARGLLIASCAVGARRDGTEVPAERLAELLPEAVRGRIAAAAEEADPSAGITLDIACPDCGRRTPAEVDIASYLWTELDAWARDVLLDVHLLATAYGWTEPDILALSPARRRYYLELCADV